MRFTLAAALVAVATPALPQTVLDNSWPAAGPDLGEVHRSVAKDFLDPQSAQYKGVTAFDAWQGGVTVCGWVNAKNQAGGYGDFIPFLWASRDGKAVLADGYNNPTLKKLVLLKINDCAGPLGLR